MPAIPVGYGGFLFDQNGQNQLYNQNGRLLVLPLQQKFKNCNKTAHKVEKNYSLCSDDRYCNMQQNRKALLKMEHRHLERTADY